MEGLSDLADAVGILRGYHTTTGEWVEASTDDLLATLRAYGLDVDGGGSCAVLAAELRARAAQRPLAPVLVAWDGRLDGVRAGGDASTLDAPGRLDLEGGGAVTVEVRAGVVRVPGRVPFGVHTLAVGADVASVIAAPRVAWRPAAGEERRWGVFVPTYALRTARSRGIGDLADLGATFDWLDGHGGQVVMTLPLLASFLDPPAEVSPYTPVSRRFWNELYLPVDDPSGSGPPDDGLLVDPAAVWVWRRPVLAARAEAFFAAGGSADLDAWEAANPLSGEYARFRAAGARHGRDWRRWGARLPDDVDPAEVRFHRYVQWRTDVALAELAARVRPRGQVLALDLPLGSHPDGFDVWRERHLFVPGMSAGAPPDDFFPLGQDWGFPPVHPERSREEGHRYWRACIRHHLRHAGLLRIDHVLGLARTFWVPHGVDPRRGVYVRGPIEELLAVVCLEAARVGAAVVGENLGTVPPEVTVTMVDHGLLGCSVGQFDLWRVPSEGYLPAPPPSVVATMNTHDTPTFAGFWSGADIADRADLGLIDADHAAADEARRAGLRTAVGDALGVDADASTATVLEAVTAAVAASDAAFVVVNVEDGWGAPDPQNVPGTTVQRPNWRRRAAVPLEGWDATPGLVRLLGAVTRSRPRPPRDGWYRPTGSPGTAGRVQGQHEGAG